MTPKQIALVQESFALVRPIADAAAAAFYDRLFETAPHLRAMFPQDLAPQRKKLMAVLGVAVASLDRIEQLLPTLHELGAKHVGYGVKEEHYAPVGAALLHTLEAGLGEAWTPETAEAWTVAFTALSGAMQDGAAQAQAKADADADADAEAA